MSSSGGDGLLTFLNADTSGENPIVTAANPVNWGKLGKTIGTSIIATVAVGVTNITASVRDAGVSLFEGVAEFIAGGTLSPVSYGTGNGWFPGLTDVLFGGLNAAFQRAFEFSAQQFGILALPVTVAIVLGSVYVLSVGFQAAASKFLGGE